MNCIKIFAQKVPEGHTILKENVSRIFPKDDSEACSLGEVVQPLEKVIQEVLQTHFEGLKFRERNAGKSKIFFFFIWRVKTPEVRGLGGQAGWAIAHPDFGRFRGKAYQIAFYLLMLAIFSERLASL